MLLQILQASTMEGAKDGNTRSDTTLHSQLYAKCAYLAQRLLGMDGIDNGEWVREI